jgi:two-component system chemotaxis response regulator CheB
MKLVFVGASTGGTEAIKQFLLGFPENCPPVFVVQHMPEAFTASFAKRLDSICAPTVIEVKGGERVAPGYVYIAPGHSHLLVRQVAGGFETELSASPPVNRHRPSVDVLFQAAAREVGAQAIGVILTGMGKDGAQGLLAMRKAGAHTYGQDEVSCVVYGMPREAVMVGAVEVVASLDELALLIMRRLNQASS